MQRAMIIDQRIAFAAARSYDPSNKEAVGADYMVVMQHTLQSPDGGSQERYIKYALLPGRRLEAFNAFDAIAAGETKCQILVPIAEEAHTKTAIGKNPVVGFRRQIHTKQEAGWIHAQRCDRTDRQTASLRARSSRHDRNTARQIPHGLAKLCRLNRADIVHWKKLTAHAHLSPQS